jgi:hypothetical protein
MDYVGLLGSGSIPGNALKHCFMSHLSNFTVYSHPVLSFNYKSTLQLIHRCITGNPNNRFVELLPTVIFCGVKAIGVMLTTRHSSVSELSVVLQNVS